MWRGRTNMARGPANAAPRCRSTWRPRAFSTSPASCKPDGGTNREGIISPRHPAPGDAMTSSDLASIPLVDVRDGGPLRHARESCERARALRDDCVAWFPRASQPAVPMLDAVARRWLTRSRSPYVDEIAAISDVLKFPGIWFLNSSYEWGCTALAREDGGVPWLARTLDWPFAGLGRHVELARMAGHAGEFWSITWAGYVGMLTGCAPGR